MKDKIVVSLAAVAVLAAVGILLGKARCRESGLFEADAGTQQSGSKNGAEVQPDSAGGKQEDPAGNTQPDSAGGKQEDPAGNTQPDSAGGKQETGNPLDPSPGHEQGSVEPYRVLSGKLAEVELPVTWKKFSCEKVLVSEVPGTRIELPDKTVVELDGTLAIGKSPRSCGLMEGEAKFEIAEAKTPFIMENRVGILEVDAPGEEETTVRSACFYADIDELPFGAGEEPEKGDNAAEMKLRVVTGEVKFQREGLRHFELVSAGEERTFRLEAVKREGEIQALGFGTSDKRGGQGKALKKRAAQMDAGRCLVEFNCGMHFTAVSEKDGLVFREAIFQVEGTVGGANYDYKPLTDEVLVCVAKAPVLRQEATARRNMNVHKGQGSTVADIHPNLPMAIQTARNNAILLIIHSAAREVYGQNLPQEVKGRFYPETYSVEEKKGQITAIVDGQVVFD